MRRWIAVTALSACVLSFTSLVGMSSGGTVTPPPSQGIASASVTAAYIEQLQLGIEFTTDPSQATNVAASINAMSGSVYGYAVQLLASQISLSQVAMADSAFMEGVTVPVGTATTPNSLTLFTTQFLPGQVAVALANGYNPTVYAAESLGLALGGNAAFNTNYVSLNARQFVSSVATRTGLNANSIAGWLQNWTAFYTANPTATQGLTITQAAYGATIGDAIGTALVNPTPIGPTNMPAGLPNTTFSSLQNQVYNALILNAEGTYVAGVAIGSLPHEMPLEGGGGSGNVAFTALHTYYMSPTGSDSNNGTSPTTPWATPNHSLNCGDIIIAEAGTYSTSQFTGSWGTVANCPSTTGGIDGTGGVYFAVVLCAGPDLMSCKVNNPSDYGFWISQNNWAIEGFWARTPIQNEVCFLGDNGGVGTPLHHIAFINDIASQCGDAGFATTGGSSANGSFDQTAVVGVVAWNAANSQTSGGECGSSVSIIPAIGSDSSAGTHIYVAGAFLGYNSNTGAPGSPGCQVGTGHSDGEGLIFDTWGAAYTANGYPYQAVVEQTVIWNSGGSSLQIFPAGATAASDKAQYFVFSTTMYSGDMDATAGAQCQADFHLHGISPTGTGLYNIYNNIVLATQTSCGDTGGYESWAADVLNGFGVTLSSANITIQNNYFYNNHSLNGYGGNNMLFCNDGDACPPTEASFIFGANTYSDPGLASPSSLWSTAPDCTGYTNVTTCMNTKYGVYAKITPSNAPTSIGYQPPGACATEVLSNGTNAFPTWLKGIVYLQMGGTLTSPTFTQNSGLITKPCAL